MDTGVRRNSPNRDSSSKNLSNTPLPVQHAPRPVEGNVARFIDQGGREAAILSLLEAIETRYPMADPEDPVDVLDESLTGTDPYAAPAAGPAR